MLSARRQANRWLAPPHGAATRWRRCCARWKSPTSRSRPARAIAACTTAWSTISATHDPKCCCVSTRRAPWHWRTATPASPANRSPSDCTPTTAAPPDEAVAAVAQWLRTAKRPLFLIGRVSNDPSDFERRVALAERVGALALTDIKTGASFPTRHPLHPFPPSLYVSGGATQALRDADVIVSLDWIDLGGTLRQACGGELPRA